MPQLPFEQSLKADQDGKLTLNDNYDLPFNSILRKLTVETLGNCTSRSHQTLFQIFKGEELLVDLQNQLITDCESYVFPKTDFALKKSSYRVVITSDGFTPNENVTIKGVLLFAFGFAIAELDGFEEQY
jgi:hypothetical protein